jgi:lysophospholipase L1-like esterase
MVPRVGHAAGGEDAARLVALARRCGFVAVADVSDAFLGHDRAALEVAQDDYHPNALGHELIARRLDAALRAVPQFARQFDAEERP